MSKKDDKTPINVEYKRKTVFGDKEEYDLNDQGLLQWTEKSKKDLEARPEFKARKAAHEAGKQYDPFLITGPKKFLGITYREEVVGKEDDKALVHANAKLGAMDRASKRPIIVKKIHADSEYIDGLVTRLESLAKKVRANKDILYEPFLTPSGNLTQLPTFDKATIAKAEQSTGYSISEASLSLSLSEFSAQLTSAADTLKNIQKITKIVRKGAKQLTPAQMSSVVAMPETLDTIAHTIGVVAAAQANGTTYYNTKEVAAAINDKVYITRDLKRVFSQENIQGLQAYDKAATERMASFTR